MVYQHATDDRDRELADAMGKRIASELRKAGGALGQTADGPHGGS